MSALGRVTDAVAVAAPDLLVIILGFGGVGTLLILG